MEYRQFGTTGLRVSVIGFGAWAIGGPAIAGSTPIGWGKTDDRDSTQALRRARECGITFYDTADFYGFGHSEELIGTVFGNDTDVVVATKVGHRLGQNGAIVLDYGAEHIRSACEQSLRRLRRDVIDYYQLHSAKLDHLQRGECVDTMERLQAEGKIRFWGLSLNTFKPEVEGDYMLSRELGDGFQCVLNLMNQRAAPFIRRAAGSGYGIIARMPLQFGLLSGKFTPDTRFSSDDHRSFRLTPEILRVSLSALEEARPLAEKLGISLTSLSLSYCASVPGVSTVIPGIRTAQQVDLNTQDIESLSSGQLSALADLYVRRFREIVSLFEQAG
jgi:aryl-alcohol dehydrogenase-like predicted oxidoreductase